MNMPITIFLLTNRYYLFIYSEAVSIGRAGSTLLSNRAISQDRELATIYMNLSAIFY